MKNQEKTVVGKQGLEDSSHLTVEHIIRANLMKIVRTAPIEDLEKAFDIEVFDPYSKETEVFLANYGNTVTHSEAELLHFARIQSVRNITFYPSIEITTTLKA